MNNIIEFQNDENSILITNLQIENKELFEELKEMDTDNLRFGLVKDLINTGFVGYKTMKVGQEVNYVEKEFEKMKQNIDKMFNPDNSKSHIACLINTLEEYFDGDGCKLHAILDPSNPDSPMFFIKKDISENHEKILEVLGYKKGISEEKERGHLKGLDYEEMVYEEINKIASVFDDTVLHTGFEQGTIRKTGDIVVELNPEHTNGATIKFVFEVKDKHVGLGEKSGIIQELQTAMNNRDAVYGIAVNSSKDNYPVSEDIGFFRRFAKDECILTVFDKEEKDPLPLEISYKIARHLAISNTLDEATKITDEFIVGKIGLVKDKLRKISNIKSLLTSASTNIENVKTELNTMQDEINQILSDLKSKISETK